MKTNLQKILEAENASKASDDLEYILCCVQRLERIYRKAFDPKEFVSDHDCKEITRIRNELNKYKQVQ